MKTNTFDYHYKWALVTGASSGIGREFARALAARGANLVLVARSRDKLEELAHELEAKHDIEAFVLPADLSRPQAPEEIFAEISRAEVPVEILVNNAGFGVYGPLETNDLQKNQEQIQVNVAALVALTQLFATGMAKANRGLIVNVASVAAFQPVPFMAVYGATKAFVLSFTEALWAEFKARGVRFFALCPGPTETAFFANAAGAEAALGKMDSARDVVATALKAIDAKRHYVIPGKIGNYLLAQVGRFSPRRMVAGIAEQIMRPRPVHGASTTGNAGAAPEPTR